MVDSRTRVAAVAGSLTLTASMLVAPVVLAQDDDPAATFGEFAATLEAFDLGALPSFFCLDQAGALGGIGITDLTAGMPPGFDFMLDAIDITVDVENAEVLSQTETEAVVDVTATMTMEFDLEPVMPMLLEMLEGFGATEEEMADMQAQMLADVPEAETQTLSGQVTMVPGETRAWVICSDLDALSPDFLDDEGMGDEGMDDEAMDSTSDDAAEADDGE